MSLLDRTIEQYERARSRIDAAIRAGEAPQSARTGGDMAIPSPAAEDAPEAAVAPVEYPIDALGDILGRAAASVSAEAQIDPAIVGQSMLAAAFVCVQGLADVKTPGGRKPLSENLLTIALSGDGKSTADGIALAPIRERESADWAEYQRDATAWAALPKAERGERPLNPLRLVADFTAEGLVRQFREGLPSLGAFSDEGGKVFGGHGFSREHKLATAAALSSLWDGTGIRARARAADERGGLEAHFDVRLSCHWMIQPQAAHDAIQDPLLGEQGFWPRCLLALPAPGKPRVYRPYSAEADPAVTAYWERVRALLARPLLAGASRALVTMTPEAEADVRAFFEATDKSARSRGGRLAPIRAWAGRATEHLLRVAGCLAVFEGRERIDADASERAAALVNYSLACWLHLLEHKPEAEAREYSSRLLAWLRAQPSGQSTETAMLRFGPRPRSAALRDAALGILEAEGRASRLGGGRWAA